jgi:hypothetical protein
VRSVRPREYRIRQLGIDRYVAEERLLFRWIAGPWRYVTSYREVTSIRCTHYTVDGARQAIRDRKESLLRADEFPRLIESHVWDGVTLALKGVA